MPVVTVQLLAGRSGEQKKALVKALTDAVCEHAKTPPEAVDVVLIEVERENWAKAGRLYSEQ
jgi:4-oxalocrotonate tautomerase